MKKPFAQYTRLLLIVIGVLVLSACGGGGGGSGSELPSADFSATLVNGNCTELQLTSLSEAGEGTILTHYKWGATLTGNTTQTVQGADVTTATFKLINCGSVAVTLTVTDSQGRTAVAQRTVNTSALAPSITDVIPKVATVNVPVTLSVTGKNLPATVVLSMADASCEVPQSVTSTGFSVVCEALTVGSRMLTIKTNIAAKGGTVIDDTRAINVTQGKLPHSGITASQCYAAGGSTLLACSQPGTLMLNGQQDGHRASVNAMSYSQVGRYPVTSCVRDNITGLIWEGKEASGTRAGSNAYTHYDSASSNQFWNGNRYVPPTRAQIDASSNSIGYVNYVNSMALCGYTDWRLPTADELQTIVDYSVLYPGPTINTTWFPNTPSSSCYWSSSPYVGSGYLAWNVIFRDGGVNGFGFRDVTCQVRLIHASE